MIYPKKQYICVIFEKSKILIEIELINNNKIYPKTINLSNIQKTLNPIFNKSITLCSSVSISHLNHKNHEPNTSIISCNFYLHFPHLSNLSLFLVYLIFTFL